MLAKKKVSNYKEKKIYNEFFFFGKSFNIYRPLSMKILCHQTKTPISFWCRQGLNSKSLIKSTKTLLITLTETHNSIMNLRSKSDTKNIYI